MAARAASIASGSLSGSRPPACAIVSRPPPPPPATCAATLTTSPAFTPRSTSAGVHAAVDGGAQDDRGGVAELALHPVGDVHERLGVGRLDHLGQDVGAVDLRR